MCVGLVRCGHFRLEGESLISAVNDNGVAGTELAAYDAAREGVLDVASYGPRQRSSAELRLVALLGEELLRRVGDLDLDALAFQVLVQAREHDVHDLQHVLLGERLEDDDLIYPVEELRPKGPLQGLARPPLGLAEVHAIARGEAELPRRDEVLAAHVGGHYNYRVLEVDHPALGVSEASVVEYLQERVEDIRVSFLDLVEEDNRVGTPADLLRELSRLFVADVAWRRADEPGDGVALLELGHVYPDHGVFLAEEELGERPRELGLAHARGTEEDEAADGTLRILYAGPGAPDGLGHGLDRGLLAHDPLVQHGLQAQETLGLFLDYVGRGHAGPLLEDVGDVLTRHLGGVRLAASGPTLLLLAQLGLELFDTLLEACGRLVVLGPDGVFLLAFEARYLLLDALDVNGRHRRAEPHLGRRLVEEVDGLVRQEAVRYVAVAELGGRDDSLLRDLHPVVCLVTVPEAEEDRHRLVHRRLVDEHGLEAPLQGLVLLHVLAVLVERGRPDDLELAARERRLEHARSVDSALCAAGPDDGVELVDKQNDVLLLLLELLEHLLHPLLEVPAESGASDEPANVEREDTLALERLGYVVRDDPLGESLGHRRLADAGLTYEYRIVLRAAGEDAHDA